MTSTLEALRTKGPTFAAQLRQLPRALRLIVRAAGGWSVAWTVLLLVQGVLPVAIVYLTKAVVDAVVAAMQAGGGWETIRPAILWVVAMALALLVSELATGLMRWVQEAQGEVVKDHLAGLIHAKSTEVDYAFYESPDYFDRLYRARHEAQYRPVQLLETLGSLVQSAITLVAMLAVLLRFGVLLPLALLVSTTPAVLVTLAYTVRRYDWRRRSTPRERRSRYHDWILTSQQTAAELRLFALGPYFRDAYQGLRTALRGEQLDLGRRELTARLGAAFFALAVTGAAMAWVVLRAIRGAYTLGDLALFYQAFNKGQGLMRGLLGGVGRIYGDVLFLGNLFEFLDLEPGVTDPPEPRPAPTPVEAGIAFQGVTFHYPGADRPALDGLDLHIPAGAITAVVGPNGAGKSTLVKLICRFYDPDDGSVTVDGVDLRDIGRDELRRRITVLFQEPVHYHDTAAWNIAVGDLETAPEEDRIRAAARAAEATDLIEGLPDGYDTHLGKWFHAGTELSVGEWQRVALARAFLREAPILLLDEPTSAMDSWAEAEWLDGFRQLARGRTALIITHRFTTAMRADRIHVLEHGRVVESGSHRELLAASRRYAVSWRRQMEARAPVPAGGSPPAGAGAPGTDTIRSITRRERDGT